MHKRPDGKTRGVPSGAENKASSAQVEGEGPQRTRS